MNIYSNKTRALAAFTLIEVVITCAIIGVIFTGFYAAIASGFSLLGLTRENLRAGEILLDKTETLRLYSWGQINSNGFIPRSFTASFDPSGPVDGRGATYYGTVEIAAAPLTVNYATNLKLVTVSLTWTNASRPRTRSMETLVSESGLQTYIY
jgi:prepilin-type N-terminal cleavage/methylation domain-containing protein